MYFPRLINSSITGNKLCVISYNSRGFSQEKYAFCNYLLSSEFCGPNVPVLCNQENFILRGNAYKIKQALSDHHILIKPAVKETTDKGRAKNGMFVAVPKEFRNKIQDVSPSHWRLQAVLLTCENATILLINSYFPVDSKKADADVHDLLEALEVLKSVIESNAFNALLLCGDLNADFLRKTVHCNTVMLTLDDLKLYSCWDDFPVDFTHYQERENNIPHVATLDHFFLTECLKNKVLDAGVFHSSENLSDHSPIYCTLDLKTLVINQKFESILSLNPTGLSLLTFQNLLVDKTYMVWVKLNYRLRHK